ncbi:hypothetical protein G5V58_17090 [Nocardioides anomalus]|uniref:Uncharacterized protein n=1 Tax=Nocardioides anomalus TaxID=2712223 RepID=A0A6G6WG04_9ACTN|nr:hypothetical protein [Nocardioides anomalus]QIG44258.1 hypothetical protein G5V58_17090 [Nocardioides anomalus]
MITFGTDEHERSLAAFWDAYVDAGRPGARYAVRHRRAVRDAVRAVRGLPALDAAPTDAPGGRAVRRVLDARVSYGVPARLLGTAVLEVPADPEDYTTGRRAQTLRRKIRAAEGRGLKPRPVEDPAERRALVAAADRAERTHADASYRVPDPDNDDLLQHDVWLTVDGPDGQPLLLAVAPRDGAFATLRYFRTLGWSDAHSDARYLATAALVTELSRLGVRYLIDTATPPEQTNGLRAFQRMVGFRYARIRLRRRA